MADTFKTYFKNLYVNLYIEQKEEIIHPQFDEIYQSYIDFLKLGKRVYIDNKKHINKIYCNRKLINNDETIIHFDNEIIDKYFYDKQFKNILCILTNGYNNQVKYRPDLLNYNTKSNILELAFITYLIDDTAVTCFSTTLEINGNEDINKLPLLVAKSKVLMNKLKRFLKFEHDSENKLNDILLKTELAISKKNNINEINKIYTNFKLRCIEQLIDYTNKMQMFYINKLKQYTKLYFQDNYDEDFINVCNFKIIFDNYIGLLFYMLQSYISYKSYIRVGYNSFEKRCKICNKFAVLKNNGNCYICDEKKNSIRSTYNKRCKKLRIEIENLYKKHKFSDDIKRRKIYFIDLKEHRFYDFDDLSKLLDDMKKELSNKLI